VSLRLLCIRTGGVRAIALRRRGKWGSMRACVRAPRIICAAALSIRWYRQQQQLLHQKQTSP